MNVLLRTEYVILKFGLIMLYKKQRGTKYYNQTKTFCCSKEIYYKNNVYLLLSKNVAYIDKKCVKVLLGVVSKISKKYPYSKIKCCIVADIPVTGKGQGSRIGKGKGPIKSSVSKIKQGKVVFEISGLPYVQVKLILQVISKYSGLNIVLKNLFFHKIYKYFK